MSSREPLASWHLRNDPYFNPLEADPGRCGTLLVEKRFGGR
jgi:hypothetical protein